LNYRQICLPLPGRIWALPRIFPRWSKIKAKAR